MNFILCFALCVCSVIYAQKPTNIGTWMPNGSVLATAEDANYIYVGGGFTHFTKTGISGTFTSGMALNTTNTGNLVSGFPIINGVVRVSVPDGNGGWFIGGDFTQVGSIVCSRLAHILPDKTVDIIWKPEANNSVYCMLVVDTDMYIGGTFTNVSGVNRNYIAKISTVGAGTVEATWNPNASNTVLALANSGTDLYVGGTFTSIGGQTRNRIAKLSTSGTGLAEATWNPDASSSVWTLALAGTDLYVGGSFTTIGGQTRNRLAKLSTTGTGAVNASWIANASNNIFALALSGSSLYVGGNFLSIGTETRNRIARVSTTTGTVDATWNPNADGGINSLLISGSQLYVGGLFTKIGGQDKYRIARISTSGSGNADNTWTSPNTNGNVITISLSGNSLFVGGSFTSTGGTLKPCLARIQKSNMELDVNWSPNPDDLVATMVLDNTHLYVGGSFKNIGGQNRSYIAKISTTNGLAEATWNPNADFSVSTLALSGTDLYAGGFFLTIGGQNRSFIAKLSTTTGLANATWNPNANSNVEILALSGTDLYVGGGFTNIGGQNRNYIAKLSTSTGSANASWNPNANDEIVGLAVSGTDIYVGGYFTNIGGQARNCIAKLDNNTGTANTNWNPQANSTVYSLTLSGTTLTIGGIFTEVNNASVRALALLDTRNPQTITFSALPNKVFGDAPFNLNATASSGLGITFTSSNPDVITLLGNTATITGVGVVNITASQLGNAATAPAPNQIQTLTVLPAAPTSLTAIPEFPFKINLSWTNVAYETGYQILRSTTAGSGYTQIATVGQNITTYQDLAAIVQGASYFYVVRATTGQLESANSNEASAIATRIDNQNIGNNIVVYPNPTQQDIYIDFPTQGNVVFTLIDTKGNIQEVITTNQSGKIIFPLLKYPKGTYILRIDGNFGRISKIIVKE